MSLNHHCQNISFLYQVLTVSCVSGDVLLREESCVPLFYQATSRRRALSLILVPLQEKTRRTFHLILAMGFYELKAWLFAKSAPSSHQEWINELGPDYHRQDRLQGVPERLFARVQGAPLPACHQNLDDVSCLGCLAPSQG